ncbi:peptidoglycan/LPS O-acetylase OafA/YrhL [Lacibacter cauensis]|uniref:Peptidoglycan/LPS O-acetylase OafA/YrhL n=1 Tax=Lacibacter cauensis TaxID=510947 RepID=A0A562SKZ2_9BACT|nr:acyltransferase [Lacibacter cauensis]TWI81400.1 peptidoglycan/LPS O-acetylase OafA/YrhL [Lacibacter cauensis]
MKIEQLTFTRFVAAIAIVVFHFNKDVFPFTVTGIDRFTVFLNVLVSYFFVLSGFILAINAKDKIDLKQFYFNRFARIYPLYLFALLATLALIRSLRPFEFELDFHRVVLSVFLVQSWTEKYALVYNYPGWSLSVEIFFYLLFPFLFKGLQLLRFKHRVLVVGLFWVVMQTLFIVFAQQKEAWVLYHPLFHLSTFVVGILGGMLYKEKQAWVMAHQALLERIFLVSALLLLFLMFTGNVVFSQVYHDGLPAPVFLLFIFIVSLNRHQLFNGFCKRVPVYLGEISYGLYILQVPVYRLLTQTFGLKASLSATSFFYFYLLVLLLVSAVCYELIEKPSRIFLRNRFSKSISI